MKVIIADHAGFCFGVKRALEKVIKASASGPLETLGPLIHNPQVVAKLAESNVYSVESLDEAKTGRIVFPSHGVTNDLRELAIKKGLTVIDAACPFVTKVHKRARDLAKSGYIVVVVGDKNHSEVRGILSAAGSSALAVSSPNEVREKTWKSKVGVVAQTTQLSERFAQVVAAIAETAPEIRAFNTICYATLDRQRAALELARNVDIMFIVGGRNSANTARLYEICKQVGIPAYHVETASEISEEWVTGKKTAGVTAGASTPDWIIAEVRNKLESM